MIYEREDFDFVDVSAIEVDGVFAPTRARNKKAVLYGEDVAWIVEGFSERLGLSRSWYQQAPSVYVEGSLFEGAGSLIGTMSPSSFGVNYLVTPCADFRHNARSSCISMLSGFDAQVRGYRMVHNWGPMFSTDHFVIDAVAHEGYAFFYDYLATIPSIKITPLSASMSADFSPLVVDDVETFFSDMTAAGTVMHMMNGDFGKMLGGVSHTMIDGTDTTRPISGAALPSWNYARSYDAQEGRYVETEIWTAFTYRPSVCISGVQRPDATWTDPRVSTGSHLRAWVVFRVILYVDGVTTYRFDAVSFALESHGTVEVEEGIPARVLMMPSTWLNSRTLAQTILGHLNVTATDYESIAIEVKDAFVDCDMNYRASLN